VVFAVLDMERLEVLFMDLVIDWVMEEELFDIIVIVDDEEVVVLLLGRFSTRAKVVPFLVI
jgi:hypothetical protein